MDPLKIIEGIQSVTKDWAKQRKAEERQHSRVARRREALTRSRSHTMKEAAEKYIAAAYLKASGNGMRPAHARQIMYAARPQIQEATGKALDDKYFTQTLLPAYLREHPDETERWDVVFDARGHFHEPHTGLIVPLGTIDVRHYLGNRSSQATANEGAKGRSICPLVETHGPANRFGAVLFVEKEGFEPLFRSARLAERFDTGIMSTKGMSVTAVRKLVDEVCGRHGVPLLILHDFDKSGFSIAGTLQRSNHRFSFQHKFKVIDLGLRLADVTRLGLDSESVVVTNRHGDMSDSFRRNLRLNGATSEEIDFLARGQRVELNAMTAPQLLEFIEDKLRANGIKKLVPDVAALESAYRRAVRSHYTAGRLAEIEREAVEHGASAKLPKGLANKVRAQLKETPIVPWDRAIDDLAYLAETTSKNGSAGAKKKG